MIDVDLTNEEYAFGIDKDQPELVEQVNAFIKEVKEDGTLDEIFRLVKFCGFYCCRLSAAEILVTDLIQRLSRLSIQKAINMSESTWNWQLFLRKSLEKNL